MCWLETIAMHPFTMHLVVIFEVETGAAFGIWISTAPGLTPLIESNWLVRLYIGVSKKKTSIIPSARPTVTPVIITIFMYDLLDLEKCVKTVGRPSGSIEAFYESKIHAE